MRWKIFVQITEGNEEQRRKKKVRRTKWLRTDSDVEGFRQVVEMIFDKPARQGLTFQ
jgi:hypothetical protein